MEFVPAHLANGELTTVSTVIYTVPADMVVMLRSIILVNKLMSSVQCYATIDFGSGERNIIPPGMNLHKLTKYDDNSVVSLETGAVIRIWCSANNAVDYIINGVLASTT